MDQLHTEKYEVIPKHPDQITLKYIMQIGNKNS